MGFAISYSWIVSKTYFMQFSTVKSAISKTSQEKLYNFLPNWFSGVKFTFIVLTKKLPSCAVFKTLILPLVKKVHSQKANEIYSDLLRDFYVSYDDAGSIGKRYRRCDAIGVPFCITVDDETINDNIVTVRNRDTMTQEKVKVSDLKEYIKNAVKF